MRHLVLLCAFAAACRFPGTGPAGDDDHPGDDDDDDDDVPADACPCPDSPDDPPVGGCTGTSEAAQPFGNHALAYAPGTILPDRPQAELDAATAGFYDRWKDRYLTAGCGAGRYFVDIESDEHLTVSEAHGFGMVVVAFMAGHDPDAHAIFDGMFRYYEDHPSEITPALMSWAQGDGCGNHDGANSASDGDLDIAYALLLADKQWSSGGAIDYRAEADEILDGIREGDVDAGGNYILLGDWTGGSGQYYDATRSSDFMPGHLASFAAATGDGTWSDIADESYDVIAAVQHGTTGLIPDFIVNPMSAPAPAPGGFLEGPRDGAFSYNACRDPWRIAMDWISNGDARAKTIVQRMVTWIRAHTGGDPGNILPGYSLSGGQVGGTYFDAAFAAPFGVAAMVDASNQAWLDDVWDHVVDSDSGYYGDTIAMLSLIAMSGNWWTPESAPCP